MTTLKDYLGSLVKDLNYARVIADVESANIAEMYAEHHLLKHFSIPRMKIQDTELTIPIAIDELDESIETVYKPVNNINVHNKIEAELKNTFRVSVFNESITSSLKKILEAGISELNQSIKNSEDVQAKFVKFIQSTAEQVITIIKNDDSGADFYKNALKFHEADDDKMLSIVISSIKKNISSELVSEKTVGKIENAVVTVESDKLKDKKPETLLFIKIKIIEESMEWQTIEDAEGNIITKLMAE